MDKVVIAGVFDFVNFYVCKALLDKGIEVRGVQFELEENEDILDEKRLEIGRNANFTELSIRDIRMDSNGKETLILSIYDLYMQYKEDFLLNENFFNMVNWERIVIFVPSQLLNNVDDIEAKTVALDIIKRTKGMNKSIQLLYLPTIYGPWQPDTFVFQHSILAGLNRGKEFKGLREETNDALFIEDTVESIIEIIENEQPGRYLLQSGKKNQWESCAAFLQISEQISNERKVEIMEENDLAKLTVKSSVPISIALTKQIEHTHRLYS
jgi:nucleoside-diphosphate-sugar epimerase